MDPSEIQVTIHGVGWVWIFFEAAQSVQNLAGRQVKESDGFAHRLHIPPLEHKIIN